MFIDKARIYVKAGNGGKGCESHYYDKRRHRHPNGGNGGQGGCVFLLADPNIETLYDFQFQRHFKAKNGQNGGSNDKTGECGQDCIVRVPVGTVVRPVTDIRLREVSNGARVEEMRHKGSARKAPLIDLDSPGERFIVAQGGAGGKGNAHYRRLNYSGPLQAQAAGGEGEEFLLSLELKLLADVGIVGFPNAGKSSLLRCISNARPKVASYPFTTRQPVLGAVAGFSAKEDERLFIAVDIPGLIEGAHKGRGMGTEFLRHIERTRILVHMIDMAGVDGRSPVSDYRSLNRELSLYDEGSDGHFARFDAAGKVQVIVANKMDLIQARENLRRFRSAVHKKVYPVSCVTKEGIEGLLRAIGEVLK